MLLLRKLAGRMQAAIAKAVRIKPVNLGKAKDPWDFTTLVASSGGGSE